MESDKEELSFNIAGDLIEFIDKSPSSFHAVKNLSALLEGFKEVKEDEDFNIVKGGSYYVVRKDSSIIAFRVPKGDYNEIRIMAAHSDSPSFKIKPDAEMVTEGHYTRINTEGYGGMIMYSWFDRPLSVAGRAVVKTKEGLESRLVNIDRDLLMIPSVAIHMNREVNKGYAFNAKTDTIPLFGDETADGRLNELIAENIGVSKEDIYGTDLFLYLREKGTLWGSNKEFISCRALDDLQCAYGGMRALKESSTESDSLNVCCVFDNEEVGSLTGQGADSTFLEDVLKRVNRALGYDEDHLLKAISKGYMISADNAHAVHPNHPEYADQKNRPYLNKGIVIKYNSSQKYTTDAWSEAMFKDICNKAEVPVQTFTNRSDMAGGSTLGNLSNRHISIKTIDIGLPQLAMHSAYETAGRKDMEYLLRAMKEFWN